MVAQDVKNLLDLKHLKDCTASNFDLRGNVVVVLGGTGVIGQAVVSDLVIHGATVALVSRHQHKVLDLVASVQRRLDNKAPVFNGSETGIFSFIGDNTTSIDKLTEFGKQIADRFGKINTLICLVGGNRKETVIAPDLNPLSIPYNEIIKTFDLNFKNGLAIPLQTIGAQMLESLSNNSSVSIIAASSMSALTPLSKVAAYGMAKAAMANYIKAMAGELAVRYGDRVRLNCVTPGFVVSEQNRTLLTTESGGLAERGKQIINHTPMGRFASAEEMSAAFVYLAGDGSRFTTGTQIIVDGGFSASTI